MVKTNAERQAAYRKRHLAPEGGNAERLDTLLSVGTARALARLAAAYGASKRTVLEHLITEGEREALAQLRGREAEYQAGRARLELTDSPTEDDKS